MNINSEQCEANNNDKITVTSLKPCSHQRQLTKNASIQAQPHCPPSIMQVRLKGLGRNGGDGGRRSRRNRGCSVAQHCQRIMSRRIKPDTSVLERKRLLDSCQYMSCTGTPQHSTHFYCTSRLSPGLWVYS